MHPQWRLLLTDPGLPWGNGWRPRVRAEPFARAPFGRPPNSRSAPERERRLRVVCPRRQRGDCLSTADTAASAVMEKHWSHYPKRLTRSGTPGFALNPPRRCDRTGRGRALGEQPAGWGHGIGTGGGTLAAPGA